MKSLNSKISNESYKVVSEYKLDHNLSKLGEALDRIIQLYKKMKGGKNKI